jgi:hypothetical protein
MAKLSFLDQLDERQIKYADKIAAKAKEMGIPPSLAVAIAYQESRLNPDVARGKSGEFGIMQVMPATGKGMGFTNKELNDPEKNIEAGLKYLKQNLDAFGGDPKMATVGYNAGTDSSFFSGGELPKTTEDYVKAMKGYGAYEADDAPPASDAEETDEQRDARMQADIDAQEKRQAQMIGAGAGAGVSATRVAGTGAGALLEAGARRVGQGFNAGVQDRPPVTPPAPPVVAPRASGALPQSVVRLPIPSGGPDAGRLASGQTGTMPYNYAKSAGLTDIEAGRALDMTKQTGGVHDLTTQRREGTQRIQQLFPGEKYVENPRYGGLLTLDQGAGSGPRQSFKVQGPLPAADLPPNFMPGPAAPPPQGTLVQLPPRQPVSTAPIPPKGPSGLDVVTDMFKSMMKPVAAVASAVSKYVLPPLALASAAGEGVNIAQQARRPEGQRDTTSMMLSGGNILGSGLSMFPPTAPVGIPLAIGTGAAQAYRDNPDFQEYIKRKMQGLANAPLLDEMTGPLP